MEIKKGGNRSEEKGIIIKTKYLGGKMKIVGVS